jgi:hypothetical protein
MKRGRMYNVRRVAPVGQAGWKHLQWHCVAGCTAPCTTFMSAINMILGIDGATHTPTPPVSSDADVAATAVVPPSPSVSTKHAMPSATPGHAGTRDS